MKKQIKIYFTDFWNNFDKKQNYFIDLLRTKYEVLLSKENPDFIIFSVFGTEFLDFNCKKVFFSGENLRPNFNNCDWAFSSDYLSYKIDEIERHYRLPIYVYIPGDVTKAIKNKLELENGTAKIEELIARKTKFCNFIYSNPACKKRNDFFHKLSKYKKVDSAGRYLNNISCKLENKIEFLKDYKFTIAFENSEYEGYTTEKIYEPFVAQSLPIYWGNPLVCKDFNKKSFLNYYDFPNEQALIDKIIEIDNDDNLLAKYLLEPAFAGNELNEFVKPENVLAQFDKIINTKITPISQKLSDKPVFIRKLDKTNRILEYKRRRFSMRVKNFSFSKIKIKLKRMRENRFR